MPTLADLKNAVGQPMESTATPQKESTVDRQLAEYTAGRERERLQRRQEIRDDIAKRAKLQTELSLVDDQLKALDGKADGAAAEHQSITTPLQEKLQGATGQQRTKLAGQLADANVDLQRTIDAIDRCRQPLLKTQAAVRLEFAQCKTPSFLSNSAVAKPSLCCDMFAAKKRQSAALARVEAAREQVHHYGSELRVAKTEPRYQSFFGHSMPNRPQRIDIELVGQLSSRLAQWRTELTCSSEEADAATRELDEIVKAMIDE